VNQGGTADRDIRPWQYFLSGIFLFPERGFYVCFRRTMACLIKCRKTEPMLKKITKNDPYKEKIK